MILEEIFKDTSFAGHFIITILAVLLSIEAGFRFGIFRCKKKNHGQVGDTIGSMIGAMLGLLAFFLAFTFGIAGTNFEARRVLVLKESNAIGTAYLRADFIPEPGRAEIRRLLREYVDVRVQTAETGKLAEGIRSSEKLLDQLWGQISLSAEKNPPTVLTGLFVQALNEVIDTHSERLLAGLHKRIPTIIWQTLYLVMVFSMFAVGYQFGMGGARSITGVLVLAITFSLVTVLISDLDDPAKGVVKTSQWSMSALQNKLNAQMQ